jgi:chromosome segregation ATPase
MEKRSLEQVSSTPTPSPHAKRLKHAPASTIAQPEQSAQLADPWQNSLGDLTSQQKGELRLAEQGIKVALDSDDEVRAKPDSDQQLADLVYSWYKRERTDYHKEKAGREEAEKRRNEAEQARVQAEAALQEQLEVNRSLSMANTTLRAELFGTNGIVSRLKEMSSTMLKSWKAETTFYKDLDRLKTAASESDAKEHEETRTRLRQLNDEYRVTEAALSELRCKHDSLATALEAKACGFDENLRLHNELEQKHIRLEDEYRSVVRTLQEVQAAGVTAGRKAETELKEVKERYQMRLESQEKELIQARKDVDRFQSGIGRIQISHTTTQRDLVSCEKDKREIATDLAMTKAKLHNAENKNKELSQVLDRLERELDGIRQTCSTVTRNLTAERDQAIQKLHNIRGTSEVRIEKLAKELHQTQTKLEILNDTSSTTINQLRAELKKASKIQSDRQVTTDKVQREVKLEARRRFNGYRKFLQQPILLPDDDQYWAKLEMNSPSLIALFENLGPINSAWLTMVVSLLMDAQDIAELLIAVSTFPFSLSRGVC